MRLIRIFKEKILSGEAQFESPKCPELNRGTRCRGVHPEAGKRDSLWVYKGRGNKKPVITNKYARWHTKQYENWQFDYQENL